MKAPCGHLEAKCIIGDYWECSKCNEPKSPDVTTNPTFSIESTTGFGMPETPSEPTLTIKCFAYPNNIWSATKCLLDYGHKGPHDWESR